MRGTLTMSIIMNNSVRIIPADAGNTAWWTDDNPGHEDHPRGCGEHNTLVEGDLKGGGSSPRMRGTQFCV